MGGVDIVATVQLRYGESKYSEARLCPDYEIYALRLKIGGDIVFVMSVIL